MSMAGRIAAIASCAVLLASCSAAAGGGSPAAAPPRPGVTLVTSLFTLRSAFNRDNGHPRLVLLFSPT